MPHPLDDALPLDPDADEAQHAYLHHLVSGLDDAAVLDLGAGAGRTALPLSDHAHVTAVELQAGLVKALDVGLLPPSAAVEANFLDPGFDPVSLPHAPFDAVLILGNTLSLIADPRETQRLFASIRRALKPGGLLVLDDTPATAWRDVGEGNWANGLAQTEEGRVQLCWHDTEPMIALRYDDEIDEAHEGLKPGDTPLRL